MCLGIPCKVVEIYTKDGLLMGKGEIGGILKEICLMYTPEVKIGDYVIVHVGFAISQLDQQEAHEMLQTLQELANMEGTGVTTIGDEESATTGENESETVTI